MLQQLGKDDWTKIQSEEAETNREHCETAHVRDSAVLNEASIRVTREARHCRGPQGWRWQDSGPSWTVGGRIAEEH